MWSSPRCITVQAVMTDCSGSPVSQYRRILVSLWLAALLAVAVPLVCPAGEQTDFPPPPMRPDALLREGIERLTDFLSTGNRPNPTQIQAFLERDIAPYFDFGYMARWAAGTLHRRMSDDQKVALSDHLRTTFLAALARNLGSYAQPLPNIDVSDAARGRSDNEIAVFATIRWRNAAPLGLEFRFYWSAEGWKIFDVAANGASAVGFYRRYYTEQLRRHGPQALVGND